VGEGLRLRNSSEPLADRRVRGDFSAHGAVHGVTNRPGFHFIADGQAMTILRDLRDWSGTATAEGKPGASGWRERLHEEELKGFAFAFKARSIATAIILVWVVASASPTRLPALLWAGAVFIVIGWIAYRSRHHPRMILIQAACAAADVAVLVLASHVPESDWYEWALQSWSRRSLFLYLSPMPPAARRSGTCPQPLCHRTARGGDHPTGDE
jgi:hypothetical protein